MSDIVKRLVNRAKSEAGRRNQAYDRFGWDNTAKSVDPLSCEAAETILALRAEVEALRGATKSSKDLSKPS